MSSFNEAASAEIEELFGRVKQGRFVATQVAVTPYEDPIGPGQINPVGFIAPNSLSQIDLFGTLIRPPVVVTSLPALPDVLYPVGSFAFLTTDAKLYRNTDGSTWSAAVASGDITGHTGIPIAAAAPALPDATYPAGSYYWNSVTLALNKTTNGTTWGLAIGAADIIANTITAGKIAAATITTTEIAAATITGGNIAAATIAASNIVADTITAAQIAAGAITASELAALSVTAAKLNILDASGATALTGAGFAGSWLDFVASGVYNDHFGAGSIANISAATIVGSASTEADYIASQSADIPLWIVNAESGAGELRRVADALAVGGVALQWSGTETADVFQDVPIIPGQAYTIEMGFRFTNSSSGFDRYVGYQFRDSVHAAIGSDSYGLEDSFSTTQATYIYEDVDITTVAPSNARFLRCRVGFTRTSGNPTVWLNNLLVEPVLRYGDLSLIGNLTRTSSINIFNAVADTKSIIKLWGSGLGLAFGPGGTTALDAYIRRSATKTLTFDSNGAGTALTSVTLAAATPLTFGTAVATIAGTAAGVVTEQVTSGSLYHVLQAADASDVGLVLSHPGDSVAASAVLVGSGGAGTYGGSLEFGKGTAARNAAILNPAANTLSFNSAGVGNGLLERHGGTAFPASPATNDQFWRTDLGMGFHYDGTRWVSDVLYLTSWEFPRGAHNNPLTTAISWDGLFPHPTLNIWMETMYGRFYVITTSTATKYWTFTCAVSGAVLSTISNTADTWVQESVAVNQALTPQSMNVGMTKVSTPGDIYVNIGYTYRLIST